MQRYQTFQMFVLHLEGTRQSFTDFFKRIVFVRLCVLGTVVRRVQEVTCTL